MTVAAQPSLEDLMTQSLAEVDTGMQVAPVEEPVAEAEPAFVAAPAIAAAAALVGKPVKIKRLNGAQRQEATRPISVTDTLTYIPRVLTTDTHTDIQLLREARKQGRHLVMTGPPGCGKTAAVRAAFADQVLRIPCHEDLDDASLVGTHRQNPTTGCYEWVDGPLLQAMKQGLVLFVDDVTLARSGVLANLYPAMDEGRFIVTQNEYTMVEAQPGFIVVGAHNPTVAGAYMPEPLQSRFALTVGFSTNMAVAEQLGVPIKLVRIAKDLEDQRRRGDKQWAPQMRELLDYRDLARDMGEAVAAASLLSGAPDNVQQELASALDTIIPSIQPLSVKDS